MPKICFIIPFWGAKFPNYFPYFLKSISWNKSIDFIFFTDIKSYSFENFSNISIVDVSLNDVENLINKKLDLKVTIEHPYKLCDFRPLYGIIFEDYVANYDFWGYCDIDIVFSDLRIFLTNNILNKYHVISCRHSYQTGFLALYRNNKEINDLFLESHDYPAILYSNKSFCADEYGTETYRQILACYPNQVINQNVEIGPSVDSITHILKRKDLPVSINDKSDYFKNRVHEFYFIEENEAFDEIVISATEVKSKKLAVAPIVVHLMYIKRRAFFEVEILNWESLTICLNKYKIGNNVESINENNKMLLTKKFKMSNLYSIDNNTVINIQDEEKIHLEDTHLLLRYYKNHQFIPNELVALLKAKQFKDVQISKIEDAVLEMIFYFFSKKILEIV